MATLPMTRLWSPFRHVVLAGLVLAVCQGSAEAAGGPGSGPAVDLGPSPTCATSPPRATGTVYYYCDCATSAGAGCTAGNDANAGTDPSAPRRTFANARSRFNGMNAGDTVALCRTGAWSENGGRIYNARCRAGNTCDFRDYVPSWGNASSPRPRLNTTSGRVFTMETAGHDEGYRYWNLDIRQYPGQGDGFFMYADVSDVDICNVYMDGMSGRPPTRSGLAVYPHSATAGTGIVIRNSQFYNYTFSAIFGGAPGLVIDGNYFENNGLPATPQNHTVYLTGNARNTGMRFTNNDTYVDAGCGGVILVFHQELPNLVVDNNRVTSPSTNVNCFGIQSSFSAYTDPAHFLNGKFRRNRLFMNGTRMEIKGCDGDCEITDNIISGGNLDIGTGSCNQAAGGGGVWCTHNAKIQNNTVYNGSLNIGGSSSGAMVENNAVTGSCNIGGTTTRNSNNVCNVNASSAWVNAAGANFTPANPGPLIGTASQTFFSPAAIGSASWSPSDPGVPRTPRHRRRGTSAVGRRGRRARGRRGARHAVGLSVADDDGIDEQGGTSVLRQAGPPPIARRSRGRSCRASSATCGSRRMLRWSPSMSQASRPFTSEPQP